MIPRDAAAFAQAVSRRLTLDLPTRIHDPFALLGVPGDAGDHTINEGAPAKPAAVLIPVVARPEPTVLLTLRSSALPSHSGQIAFPGGKIDPGDGTPLAAALREAEEEVGLDRRFVQPLGYLLPFLSRTGYLITPVVGMVEPGFELTINPSEVTDAFEVPLAFLMDERNHQRQTRHLNGRDRVVFAMPYGERYIWGITATILRDLWQRLADPVAVEGA
ncbi:CoA pyrophosphatase [Phreatobacter aquaticus]|uniref:CoA pyrophosphatase n=1 Tax=Phreatobacter aquaticus TaxID=2570229 RepID=UPI00208E4C3C|nr:CoA pyrophosphatase [Phreatobacter aquaticus]